jgi:predicted ATPase
LLSLPRPFVRYLTRPGRPRTINGFARPQELALPWLDTSFFNRYFVIARKKQQKNQ